MWKIIAHPLVDKEDFRKIQKSDVQKILRIIYKKLTLDPKAFGKPLTGVLKGFYRLRIDPYRVVYKIEGTEVVVYIIKVGLRKDLIVYLEAAKRIGLIK